MTTTTNTTRAQIQKLIGENRETISANLCDFFRGWHGDLIAAGVDEGEVIEAMLAVATTQATKLIGPADAARYLETVAAKLDDFATSGKMKRSEAVH